MDNVPKIRLKGFFGAWAENKLNELAEIRTGPFGSVLHAEDYVEDGVPIVTTEHFKNGALPNVKDGIPQVSESDYNRLKGYRLTCGDIVFSRVGSVDVNAEVKKQHEGWLFSGRVLRVRPKQEIDSCLLHYLLDTKTVRDDILSRAVGQTMPSINTQILGETKLICPNSAEEQVKIGQIFTCLGSLITHHENGLEQLRKAKRYFLQKMFPQEGLDVPELRFAGFSGAWEQKKLGDLMDVTSVRRIHQSDWTNTGIRFLRARDLVAKFKNEAITEPLFISKEKYEEYSALSGKVKSGDLLVTGVGTIGVPMLIENEDPLYFKDGNIIWFKNNKSIDGNFLYYSFIGDSIQKFIHETSGSGTVGTYTIDSGKNTVISLPLTQEEQKKIGAFCKALDSLITQRTLELAQLRKLKHFLLQNMFPP